MNDFTYSCFWLKIKLPDNILEVKGGCLFGFENIEKFLSVFIKDPVDCQANQCVKHLSKTSACQDCVPACHMDAINLSNGLDLDITKCDGCGFCIQACPNGVFDVNSPPDIELLSQTKFLSNESKQLIFACKPNLIGKLRPNELSIACFGRLSEGFLLAAAIYGFDEIVLDGYYCDDCARYRPELLAKIIDTANLIARQLGIDCEFLISRAQIERKSDKSEVADHGMHLSRRNFLEHLKKRTVDSTSELIVKSLPDFEEEKKGLPKRVPANRSLIRQVLKRLKLEDSKIRAPGFFNEVHIEENCSACDFCSNMCPTGALQKKTEDGAVKISLTPYLCTGCKLCVDVCPHASITVNSSDEGIVFSDKYDLIDAVLAKCSKCGIEFASRENEEKCIFCKKKEQLFA